MSDGASLDFEGRREPPLVGDRRSRARPSALHGHSAAADRAGLLRNGTYRSCREDEIALIQSAYVGAAETEIATLRAGLDGPLLG